MKKLFYYMTSISTGILKIYADSFWQAYHGVRFWFDPDATIVMWDENDDIRIFHGEE